MKFYVATEPVESDSILLVPDNWDDWFRYKTLYKSYYIDKNSVRHELGLVKIAINRQGDTPQNHEAPTNFEELGDEYISLGQDYVYYQNIHKVASFIGSGSEFSMDYLKAMSDISANSSLFRTSKEYDVVKNSLMRFVEESEYRQKLIPACTGKSPVEDIEFSFPLTNDGEKQGILDFKIDAFSMPPTNIHVLVGRNGVGKTTALKSIARNTVQSHIDSDINFPLYGKFANIIYASFSAFDRFEDISTSKMGEFSYSYIGIRKKTTKEGENPLKDEKYVKGELRKTLNSCFETPAKLNRLKKIIKYLDSDPIFSNGVVAVIDKEEEKESIIKNIQNAYSDLSSGHKIILLNIIHLVDKVEDSTLVLLDEPEAHLHPPLLSAFMRSLSELLFERNGVAIIATHSPVVVQEVPKSCVWILHSSGRFKVAERPKRETFGESIDALTNDLFGLEVTSTGFHRMLQELSYKSENYEVAMDALGSQLGSDGRILLRSMFMQHVES